MSPPLRVSLTEGYCMDFPPLRGPTSKLLDVMCPRLEVNMNPTPLQGFSPLRGSIHSWDFPNLEMRHIGTTTVGQIITRGLHVVNP